MRILHNYIFLTTDISLCCDFQGMACVGRTKVCSIVPPNHFGPIPGVPVGSAWKFRVQVRLSSCYHYLMCHLLCKWIRLLLLFGSINKNLYCLRFVC